MTLDKFHDLFVKITILPAIIFAGIFWYAAITSNPVHAQKPQKWEDVKSKCENAKEENVRIPLDWPEDYFNRFQSPPSFEQKEEILYLWILSVKGGYNSHVLPGIRAYVSLYDSKIRSETSEKERSRLLGDEITKLGMVFYYLDFQIRIYFDSTLNKSRTKGFYSPEIGDSLRLTSRVKEKFHSKERYVVWELLNTKLPDNLSLKEYGDYVRKFPDILKQTK